MNLVHQQFGEVWVEQRNDGSIWFAAKDICKILKYNNTHAAIKKHVPAKYTSYTKRDVTTKRGFTQNQKIKVINKTGVFRLLLRSKTLQSEVLLSYITDTILNTADLSKVINYIQNH